MPRHFYALRFKVRNEGVVKQTDNPNLSETASKLLFHDSSGETRLEVEYPLLFDELLAQGWGLVSERQEFLKNGKAAGFFHVTFQKYSEDHPHHALKDLVKETLKMGIEIAAEEAMTGGF